MIGHLEKHPQAFQPETIEILGAALDEAWERVRSSGAMFDGGAAAPRDVLAKHIIEMAKRGELDRKRLVDDALLRLKL